MCHDSNGWWFDQTKYEIAKNLNGTSEENHKFRESYVQDLPSKEQIPKLCTQK